MLQWRSRHAVLITLVTLAAVVASLDGWWGFLASYNW